MSLFSCPSCGHQEPIFGEGGGRREADRLQVPFLGSIPLDPRIREGGDTGVPMVASAPDSSVASAFAQVTSAVRRGVELPSAG
jgi:ATP-binding protein involved in chromosome partitioning